MVVRKRKYESGAATAFLSRNQALRKLQLSLSDFRRLCILKGIHPHEPRHPKKVGKGSTQPKTYYLKKDIQFMAQEPIINKFRDFRSYVKRLKKAVHKGDKDKARRSRNNKPKYKLDHIIKERYPRFTDAVRDLDDCLSMCCLFGTLQVTKNSPTAFINVCRRRTVEFFHYVIAARALRKVFVSIKGIYYQADIQGEPVTWVVRHKRGFSTASDVDYRVMSTFIEFYSMMLGFVNHRLYSTLGLHYPPQLRLPEDNDSDMCLKNERFEERLAAMTQSLTSSRAEDDEPEMDEFPVDESGDSEAIEKAKAEAAEVKKLRHLFDGLKFFLNRETPKESLTMVIRSFGGSVSWDKLDGLGSTYQEDDSSITHQIVDKDTIPQRYLSRLYVQPQWVYDCVNARRLLPNSRYAPGASLPPHLSPFGAEEEGEYQPPEAQGLLSPAEQLDQEDEQESEEEEEETSEPQVKEPPRKRKKKEMMVTPGTAEKSEAVARKEEEEQREQQKLREMMVPKKKRRLYNKIRYKQKKINQEKEKLTEKRRILEETQKTAKKGSVSKPATPAKKPKVAKSPASAKPVKSTASAKAAKTSSGVKSRKRSRKSK